MAVTRPAPRILAPAIVAVLIVQGMLGLLPHDHRSEAVADLSPSTSQSSRADCHQVGSVRGHLPSSTCLLCVAATTVFAQPDRSAAPLPDPTACPTATASSETPSIPGPWRYPHRGPPDRA